MPDPRHPYMDTVRLHLRENMGGFAEAASRAMLNADSGAPFREFLFKALVQADKENEMRIRAAFPGLDLFFDSTNTPEKRVDLLAKALPHLFP